MRYRDVVSYVEDCKTSGASMDDLKARFDGQDTEEINRLLQSAMDNGEIKKDGKGRGTRYYDSRVEIVKIMPTAEPKYDGNYVANIDVKGCNTTREKIEKILASDTPLARLVTLGFKESMLEKPTGKDLLDFVKDGSRYKEFGLMHDNSKKKNVIYKKSVRSKGNKVTFYRDDDKWYLEKWYPDCPRPDVTEFNKWEDLQKCLSQLVK